MAKRRLNKQQKRRIDAAKKPQNQDLTHCHSGTVISHHGGTLEILPVDKEDTIDCHIRTNLGDIVCGDQVYFRSENNEWVVVSVTERSSLLQRLDGFQQQKLVAANLSQMIVCLAIEPEPNLFLLDQFLVAAEQQKMNIVIIVNKIDMNNNDSDPFEINKIYAELGYRIIHCSAKTGEGIDQLEQACIAKRSVISGVSGVGKSSITKAILPQTDIKIGEISEFNREGKHTTRTSRLYALPQGGELIDTPGIRGFNSCDRQYR